MKIATFNVNGITSRLPRLLEWLEEAEPDIACLQELKTSDDTFPRLEIEAAGYSAVWHGQKGFNGVAVLARGGGGLTERRRGLPGDPDDTHSRYLEASAHGVIVASIYLPNGNPQPGPKFDYKLAWFARLIEHAASLVGSAEPVLLIGDYNVVATDGKGDIYNPASWKKDALLQPREPRRLPAPARPGLDRRDPCAARRRADLHLLGLLPRPLRARRGPAHRPPAAQRAGAKRGCAKPASTARCAAARSRATTRRPGSCSTEAPRRRCGCSRPARCRHCGPWLYGILRRRALRS